MKTWPKAFATACVFLTRIPMPTMAEVSAQDEGRCLACFPLVGALLGIILTLSACITLPIFGTTVSAAIIVTLWAAITGGLHLDGLADSADGWLGGYGDPERTLEIMHDSRCGSGALVAVGCLLITKFAALTVILDYQLWAALLVAPIVGRCTGPLLFIKGTPFYAPYVKPTGIAKHFIDYCPTFAPYASLGAILVSGFLLDSPITALTILSICAITLLLLKRLMLQRLCGATGDTAGASTEIIETVLLLAAGALLNV